MQSTPKPSDATFGQAPTFNSDAGFVLDVSYRRILVTEVVRRQRIELAI